MVALQQAELSATDLSSGREVQRIQKSEEIDRSAENSLVWLEGSLRKQRGSGVAAATIKAITECGDVIGFAMTDKRGEFKIQVPPLLRCFSP